MVREVRTLIEAGEPGGVPQISTLPGYPNRRIGARCSRIKGRVRKRKALDTMQ